MSEKRLQNALYFFRRRQHHTFITPNAVMAWGEVDLLSVTKLGLIVEHEIKISRGDFKADAKKEWKHAFLTGDLVDGFTEKNRDQDKCPNYFFYTVPTNLIKPEDVPAYAGLIYVSPEGVCRIAKNAPRLHDRKIPQNVLLRLGAKLGERFWQMRIKFKENYI